MNTEQFENLLAEYWDIAYEEGKTGKPNGVNANRVLREIKAALAAQAQQPTDELTVADYEKCLEDYRRLAREIGIALNGKNAARQPSLCDILGQLQGYRPSAETGLHDRLAAQAQQEAIGEVQHYAAPANLPAYVNVKWYGKPPKNGTKVYALPPAPEGGE